LIVYLGKARDLSVAADAKHETVQLTLTDIYSDIYSGVATVFRMTPAEARVISGELDKAADKAGRLATVLAQIEKYQTELKALSR
jgi:hypothetical protein